MKLEIFVLMYQSDAFVGVPLSDDPLFPCAYITYYLN